MGLNQRLYSPLFVLTSVPILAGPWLFGAWEMWWFWIFACSIFGGLLLFCAEQRDGASLEPFLKTLRPRSPSAWFFMSCVPFLLYAGVRTCQADVRMDAERNLLLFATPVLIGMVIAFGFTAKQKSQLWLLLFANLVLIGTYGIANHFVTRDRWVLWAPGEPQYVAEHRATGPYFCPDHFAGSMELLLAMALGVLFAEAPRRHLRGMAIGATILALAGIVFSKSRGGGLTVVIMLIAVLVWGFAQQPPRQRWWNRISYACLGLIAVVLFVQAGDQYMDRFKTHFNWSKAQTQPPREAIQTIRDALLESSRGRMIAGALRAWQTAPVWGIGPGMHQNLWPRFAATPDGDRASGKWPRQLNHDFHSYEVHSDWVQLLEEYGVVGLFLFLIPTGVLCTFLVQRVRAEQRRLADGHWRVAGTPHHHMTLGALLAFVAMAFHSFGDFNLQIPGTTWMLAAILITGLSASADMDTPASQPG